MSDKDVVELKGLNQLIRALKTKTPQIRVGVLDSMDSRDEENKKKDKKTPTNSEIGAAHEYGSPARGIPQRSFLRVPISEHLQKYMEKSGGLNKDVLKKVIKEGNLLEWADKTAKIAEQIVEEAFASNGFGKWEKWKSGYTSKTGQILVNTTQLRQSISSEVEK